MTDAFDPALDLRIQRELPLTPAQVWRAWTEPGLLMQWFTPKPWRTTECRIDLRPGGVFATVMQGPDGDEGGGDGCYLEVVPERRLVWTGALQPGFRPAAIEPGVPVFTATITMEPLGRGTLYTSTAAHPTPEARDVHAAMGFEQGWGAALDQLVDLMTVLEGPSC
jgi:uncharacterized protein YndB with AHSA1/START domain